MKYKVGDYVTLKKGNRTPHKVWREAWAANNWIAQVLKVHSSSVKLTIRGFPRRGDSWWTWDERLIRKLNGIEVVKLRHNL
jgi:hypothetical protein